MEKKVAKSIKKEDMKNTPVTAARLHMLFMKCDTTRARDNQKVD